MLLQLQKQQELPSECVTDAVKPLMIYRASVKLWLPCGPTTARGLKIKCVFVLVFFGVFFTALIILLSTETMKNVIKTSCQSVLPLIKNTGNARREQNTGVKRARKQIMSKSVCSEKCFSNVFIWIHKRKKALSLHKYSECFLSKLCFRRDVFMSATCCCTSVSHTSVWELLPFFFF